MWSEKIIFIVLYVRVGGCLRQTCFFYLCFFNFSIIVKWQWSIRHSPLCDLARGGPTHWHIWVDIWSVYLDGYLFAISVWIFDQYIWMDICLAYLDGYLFAISGWIFDQYKKRSSQALNWIDSCFSHQLNKILK